MRRALLLACALLVSTCAAHQTTQVAHLPPTPHIWVPLAIPDDVVMCVALPGRWSCHTLGELRQILWTQGRS